MDFGQITVVGDGGLLGEIVAREFARHGTLSAVPDIRTLDAETISPPDIVAIWPTAGQIGQIRQQLRGALPVHADPLLLFVSHADPFVYFTRLRDMHVDRRRLGFHDVFDEIAARLTAGAAITASARAGTV